ncbi:LysR family transcriptional regulator [Streptomyces gobiensis]|uniref:LysR family transcriptional regulator n=1 Tax=Streptomyces gobiensis TaxID=2875706 RepID=UPI001E5EC7D1|nr:LysR family transcriptional regulator [Streptomyces gobiensis]UGY93294.1 LysR family transcriptional regulator [Streptomyces gobiensis]
MSPTLQQLRYLAAVADCRSITGAAAAVYVAQPALSRAIQALERDLGVELLIRTGRGVELTPEGARVVRLTRIVLSAVDAIEDISPARGHGALSISATPTLAIDLATALLPGFTQAHPGVRVRLVQYDSREAVAQSLRDGDSALALVDLPVDKELASFPLQEREVVLISPTGTRLPDPMPFDRLDGLPLVLPTPGTGRRTELEEMFGRLRVRPMAALEVDERLAWVTAVSAGHGSLIWYRDTAVRAFGNRVEIRSFVQPLLRPVGIAHARRALDRDARAFLTYVRLGGPVREPAR